MMVKKTKSVTVTLTRSVIGEKPKTRATVAALGLKRIRQSATHEDTPSLRGMLNKVQHLVDVEDEG